MTLSLHGTVVTSFEQATVTLPADIPEGALIVMWDAVQGLLVGAPPAGFQEIVEAQINATTDAVGNLSYKIAEGDEGGTNITGNSGGNEVKIAAVFVDDNGPIVSVAVQGITNVTDGNNDPADIVLNASGGAAPLIAISAAASSGDISTHVMDVTGEVVTNENGGSYNASLAYKLYDSSPADVTASIDDHGNRNLFVGAYLELTIQGDTALTAEQATDTETAQSVNLYGPTIMAAAQATDAETGQDADLLIRRPTYDIEVETPDYSSARKEAPVLYDDREEDPALEG